MTSLREKVLQHASAQTYDPSARRERYLRERKLKGRRVGSTSPPPEGESNTPDNGSKKPGQSGRTPPSSPPGTPVTPERVAALKVRLEQLKKILTALVEQAKEAAGVETTPKEDKKSAESKDEPEEKKTAAEKKDEAKKAKERRDKEPPKPDTASSVKAEIASVQKKIEDARANLAAARKAASSKKPPPKETKNQTFTSKEKDDNQRPDKQPTENEGRQH